MDPFTKIVSRKFRDEIGSVVDRAKGQDVGGALNQLRGEAATMLSQFYRPAVDVLRRDDHLLVLVEAPGYRKQDLDVLLPDDEPMDRIRVKGKRVQAEGEPLYEERLRSFDRVVPIPEPCEARDVSASLSDGVLRVEIECSPGTFGKRVEIQ